MLPTPVPVTQSIARSGISPQMLDMDTIGGIAIALGGVGGGIALIALFLFYFMFPKFFFYKLLSVVVSKPGFFSVVL